MISSDVTPVPWHAGRHLAPVRRGGLPGRVQQWRCSAGEAGTLAWTGAGSVRLLLRPAEGEWERAGLTLHGLQLEAAPTRCIGLAVAPGLMAGLVDGAVRFILQAADQVAETRGGTARIDLPGVHVLLTSEQFGGATRWAVACSAESAEHARAQALAAAGLPFEALWREEEQILRELPARFAPQDAWRETVRDACATLAGAVRNPEGSIHGAWLDTGRDEAEFDTGWTALLLPVLARLDPDAAREIAATLLRLQEPDGLVPGLVAPDRSTGRRLVPPPLFTRALSAVTAAAADLDLASAAVPALGRLLRAQLSHYRAQDGLCTARHPAETLFPLLYDDELASPELPALLIQEIDALHKLSAPFPDYAGTLAELGAERGRLLADLEGPLSHEQCGLAGRYPDGRQTRRRTASALPALGVPELAATTRERLRKLLQPEGPLRSRRGVLDYESWQGENDAPPVRASTQILVLQAIASLPEDEAGPVRDLLRSAAPTLLAEAETAADRLAAAALVLQLTPSVAADAMTGTLGRGFVDALDRHRRKLALAGAGLLVGGIGLLGLRIYETAQETPAGEIMAHAEESYRDGRIGEAAEQFEALRSGPARDTFKADLRLGNARFRLRDFAAAERAYRDALAHQPDQPEAWMNLALAVHEQGRLTEARAAYEDVLTHYAKHYPDLARRAQLAIALIDERTGKHPPPR